MCLHLLCDFFSPPVVYLSQISQGVPIKISCQHLSLYDAKLTPLALWLPGINGKDIYTYVGVFLSLPKCDRGSVRLGCEPYSCLHGLFLLFDGI